MTQPGGGQKMGRTEQNKVNGLETGTGSCVILMDEIATSERHHLPRRGKKDRNQRLLQAEKATSKRPGQCRSQ